MVVKKKRLGAPSGPRAVNIAETRERILMAAISQFAQHSFSGARIENICLQADVNPRMIYHYFQDKAGLYVAVLEHVLGNLRAHELKLDVLNSVPLEGLLSMFDFTFNHFDQHPELIRILSAENLMESAFLKNSTATPLAASPVVQHIKTLLERGEDDRSLRRGLDPLHLYVVMVSLSYFHKSNAYTLAVIWGKQLTTEKWRKEHRKLSRDILKTYLRASDK